MAAEKYLTIVGNKKTLRTASQANTGTEVIVSTDPDGFINQSFLKQGETWNRIAFEALGAGNAVNIFSDVGVAKARKADASAHATRCTGFVLAGVAILGTAVVVSEGIITGLTGLTIGDPVFLDAVTPGGFTQTPPVAAGEIWQKLGDAISATEMRIEIGEAIQL